MSSEAVRLGALVGLLQSTAAVLPSWGTGSVPDWRGAAADGYRGRLRAWHRDCATAARALHGAAGVVRAHAAALGAVFAEPGPDTGLDTRSGTQAGVGASRGGRSYPEPEGETGAVGAAARGTGSGYGAGPGDLAAAAAELRVAASRLRALHVAVEGASVPSGASASWETHRRAREAIAGAAALLGRAARGAGALAAGVARCADAYMEAERGAFDRLARAIAEVAAARTGVAAPEPRPAGRGFLLGSGAGPGGGTGRDSGRDQDRDHGTGAGAGAGSPADGHGARGSAPGDGGPAVEEGAGPGEGGPRGTFFGAGTPGAGADGRNTTGEGTRDDSREAAGEEGTGAGAGGAEGDTRRRAEIVGRAERWADLGLDYSMTGLFEGYRKDCSGLVSMAWGLPPPGLTTPELPGVSHRVAKAELLPGDILLNTAPGAAGHTVVFAGWADSAHTRYHAVEESGGKGAHRAVIPYPYWPGHGEFRPYRLD